jgi:hypothetical protein
LIGDVRRLPHTRSTIAPQLYCTTVPDEFVNVVVEPSWFGVKYFPLLASG